MQSPPSPPDPPPPPARLARPSFPGPQASYLGVGLQEIDANRANTLHLKEVAGVEITQVEPDSPAAKAGLQSGDVILEYNGVKVVGFEQFSRLVRETPTGRDVKIRISRAGADQTMVVKIGSHHMRPPGSEAFLMPPMPSMPPMPRIHMQGFSMPDISHMSWRSPILGIEAEGLGSQLAQYFGVKQGVLVRSVLEDSPAAKAGMKAGDVILKVEDHPVVTPGEVSAAVGGPNAKHAIPILVMRDHKETALSVTIDADHSGN
ncbi:MAG: PDZ domain-containing protein [Bryobacteraceae bacterium]